MKIIKNRVLKQEFVDWRSLEWMQGDLKEISDEGLESLIHSIIEDDIIKSFHVWENKDKLYCLDGNHLKKALIEIKKRKWAEIPEQLKADFIDCKNINEAAELVLKYSAVYTEIVAEGLDSFLDKYKIKRGWTDFRKGIKLPDFNMDWFENIYINDKLYVPNIEPKQSNKIISRKDIERISDKLQNKYEIDNQTVQLTCPHCGSDFEFAI